MPIRIYLNHGYRGKDMGDVFYPVGEHEFPDAIAERLIGSGQALRIGRGKVQDFVGVPQNAAVTFEEVLSKIEDLPDDKLIELAAVNGIIIPDGTTRPRATAALLEAALRPNAVFNLDYVTSKAVPIYPRLADDEAERQQMLHEAGKLPHHPHQPSDDPLPDGTDAWNEKTTAELKTLATARGLSFKSNASKDDLIALLKGK